MENLDIYDENENFIGVVSRAEAHLKGLWHKTVHVWILRPNGKILFQMRAKNLKDNPSKLYTSASGHVSSGESLPEAVVREVSEELGINLDMQKTHFVSKNKFTADFLRTDGTEFHDRAIFNVFFLPDDNSLLDYNFQDEELDGLFELPIKQTLEIMRTGTGAVSASGVIKENEKNIYTERQFSLEDFLILKSDTPMGKFGWVLEKALAFKP